MKKKKNVCVCVFVCNFIPLLVDLFDGFFRDIWAKFGINNSPQYPDIGQKSDGGIYDFPISVQSLIKVNCPNSRTSDDIDMKLGPVTKIDKRNKTTSKDLTMM